MGWWPRGCCSKFEWPNSKAKLVSDDLLLSFTSFGWGVLVFLAAKSELIKDTEEAAGFQNFIICVEMLIAAFAHLYAFPYKEYAGANIGPPRGYTASLGHALMLNDFYHDTVHQFAPTYHDYVLYNHGDAEEVGATKYKARTFVPTGPEMDTVGKNKHIFANKQDDVQLSSLSPSANNNNTQNPVAGQQTGKSENYSLLMDASTNVSAPYDLSLIDVDISNYPSRVPAANPGLR